METLKKYTEISEKPCKITEMFSNDENMGHVYANLLENNIVINHSFFTKKDFRQNGDNVQKLFDLLSADYTVFSYSDDELEKLTNAFASQSIKLQIIQSVADILASEPTYENHPFFNTVEMWNVIGSDDRIRFFGLDFDVNYFKQQFMLLSTNPKIVTGLSTRNFIIMKVFDMVFDLIKNGDNSIDVNLSYGEDHAGSKLYETILEILTTYNVPIQKEQKEFANGFINIVIKTYFDNVEYSKENDIASIMNFI